MNRQTIITVCFLLLVLLGSIYVMRWQTAQDVKGTIDLIEAVNTQVLWNNSPGGSDHSSHLRHWLSEHPRHPLVATVRECADLQARSSGNTSKLLALQLYLNGSTNLKP
jgi:hypothetical protein